MKLFTFLALSAVSFFGLASHTLCSSMCRIYHEGNLYNFEGIFEDKEFTIKNINPNAKFIFSLCQPISAYLLDGFNDVTKFAVPQGTLNLAVTLTTLDEADHSKVTNRTYRQLGFLNSESDQSWKVTFNNRKSALTPFASNSINYAFSLIDQSTKELTSITSVEAQLTCSGGLGFSDVHTSTHPRGKLLVFNYVGPKACKIQFDDYLQFFSENIAFIGILFTTSIVGLFLPKSCERFGMSLTSAQAAVMITAATCIYLNKVYSSSYNTENFFTIAALISAFAVFGLSYFSRYIAVFFVSIGLSYSIAWTLMYILTVSFQISIPFLYYLITNCVCMISVMLVSCYFPRFRERYSFGVYTSITNPFFLMTSLAIYFRFYLDVITYGKYRDYGRNDMITTNTWIFIPVQLFMTLVLAFVRCKGNSFTRSPVKQPERASVGLLSDPLLRNDRSIRSSSINPTIVSM